MDSLLQSLDERFNFLADKAIEVVPYLWDIALRQVYVDTISWCVVTFIVFVISAVLFFVALIKSNSDSWFDSNDWFSILFWGGAVMVISFFIFVFHGVHLIQVLNNPEYYAIQKFLEMVTLQ